jgi:S-adenosylmethionine-dependent methyltransferase
MGEPQNVFDAAIEGWKTEQALPWNGLKYELARANVQRHLARANGRVLDAGGGNGLDSVPLAELGFDVEIVDSSQAMLAEAARYAASVGVQHRVHLHHAGLDEAAAVTAGRPFDLILCHNVMQYLPDVPGVLAKLGGLLEAGGLLSLVSLNRYSIPYKTAFFENNLEKALGELDARTTRVYLFDATVTTYTSEEASDLLRQSGLAIEADYGLRCLTDFWGTNEQKFDPETFERLAQLEAALAGQHPYKLLARFFQVIARKPQ